MVSKFYLHIQQGKVTPIDSVLTPAIAVKFFDLSFFTGSESLLNCTRCDWATPLGLSHAQPKDLIA